MAQWDRSDICLGHAALENDFNFGGWLRERRSNQRRMEATSVQLHRLGFSMGMGAAVSFNALAAGGSELENACDIYIEALVRFGLAKLVSEDDEIAKYVKERYVNEYVAEHFTQLYK